VVTATRHTGPHYRLAEQCQALQLLLATSVRYDHRDFCLLALFHRDDRGKGQKLIALIERVVQQRNCSTLFHLLQQEALPVTPTGRSSSHSNRTLFQSLRQDALPVTPAGRSSSHSSRTLFQLLRQDALPVTPAGRSSSHSDRTLFYSFQQDALTVTPAGRFSSHSSRTLFRSLQQEGCRMTMSRLTVGAK
jgi:hypothetical protein